MHSAQCNFIRNRARVIGRSTGRRGSLAALWALINTIDPEKTGQQVSCPECSKAREKEHLAKETKCKNQK